MNTEFSPLQEKVKAELSSAIPQKDSLLKRFFLQPSSLLGFVLVVSCILLALIYPLFSPYSYDQVHLASKNLPPSWQHLCGTDDLGRDILTRLCYGTRISIFVALSAAILDMIFGVLWGGIAGLFEGLLGQLMMRFVDILTALPHILIVILLLVVFPPSIFTIILALALTGWLNMARLVRGQILSLKQKPFITVSKTLGAGPWHLLFKHLIPNTSGTIFVALTFSIPSAIFMEAFLSFIGLGIQAPISSLGVMASEGVAALSYYPWRLFFPALMISLLTFSFHCMGNTLSDLLNPKLQAELRV